MDKGIPLLELLHSTAMQAGGDEDGKDKKKKQKCKKRSRPTPCIDNKRKTHITVERNRRRLMNDHLAALRSLMPPMYVQRGDQASVVAGTIDFVKELEQLLLSLHTEKKGSTSSSTTPAGFSFISPQFTGECNHGVEVEASLVQGHVSIKVLSPRRPGQLVRAIAALEELRLTVQHLNVTSLSSNSMFYSLNLKMEEECKLGCADEIASSVHQIFRCINTPVEMIKEKVEVGNNQKGEWSTVVQLL